MRILHFCSFYPDIQRRRALLPQAQGTMSGLLITASIGGAIVPPLVGFTADHLGWQVAMKIPVVCFAFVLVVSLLGKAVYE